MSCNYWKIIVRFLKAPFKKNTKRQFIEIAFLLHHKNMPASACVCDVGKDAQWDMYGHTSPCATHAHMCIRMYI